MNRHACMFRELRGDRIKPKPLCAVCVQHATHDQHTAVAPELQYQHQGFAVLH